MNIQSIEHKLDEYRPFLEFILRVLIAYFFWRIIQITAGEESVPLELRWFPTFSAIWESIHDGLRWLLMMSSFHILLGFGADISHDHYSIISQSGYALISLGNYCLGMEMMFLFLILILSFPGTPFKKLTFIPIGLVCIQLVNTLRIVGLYYIYLYYPQYMDVNHHVVFRAVVFGVILALFYLWLQWESNTDSDDISDLS